MHHAVLIVEDNPMNMELASDILSAAGHRVIHAVDATQAIALAKFHKPALILMDISLPGMDGLTATCILKADAQTCRIPVVALTAHAMIGDEERVLNAGCDDYLTKPVDAKKLVEVVARYAPTGQTK